ACAENGKGEGEVALFRYVFVARSKNEAVIAAGGPFIQAFESMYLRWPHPVVKRPPGQLTIERLAHDRIILGDAKTCVDEINRFADVEPLLHVPDAGGDGMDHRYSEIFLHWDHIDDAPGAGAEKINPLSAGMLEKRSLEMVVDLFRRETARLTG